MGATRACDSPTPNAQGADCIGASTTICENTLCPVDGVWTSWTISTTCGESYQSRSCEDIANGGFDCVGTSVKIITLDACPTTSTTSTTTVLTTTTAPTTTSTLKLLTPEAGGAVLVAKVTDAPTTSGSIGIIAGAAGGGGVIAIVIVIIALIVRSKKKAQAALTTVAPQGS